jgi:hypothetical protein
MERIPLHAKELFLQVRSLKAAQAVIRADTTVTGNKQGEWVTSQRIAHRSGAPRLAEFGRHPTIGPDLPIGYRECHAQDLLLKRGATGQVKAFE